MPVTKLQQALSKVNGKRRERLLGLGNIVGAAAGLKPGQHVFLHGGHVANAYGYPAVATGAVVWIPKGKRSALVAVRLVNAKRGSTGFGHESNWTADRLGYTCVGAVGGPVPVTPEDKRAAA